MKQNTSRQNPMSIEAINERNLPFLTPRNVVAIYTVVHILLQMRRDLGVEAMLEYMETYLACLERDNPKFKKTIKMVLSLMDVEKMYRDAVES